MTTPAAQPNLTQPDPNDSAPELKVMDWSQIVVVTDEMETPQDDPTYPSERIDGEPSEREFQRDREQAYNSDLTLEEQMSQFLAAPWDEEQYEDYDSEREPVYNYVELERLKRSDPERYQRYLNQQAVNEAARQADYLKEKAEAEAAGIQPRILDL